MNLVLHVIGWSVFICGTAGTAYAILSARFVGRFAAAAVLARGAAPAVRDGVILLKPLHGAEPRLRQNLDSFFSEAKHAGASIVFGLQDPQDPAREVLEALMAEHPEVAARLVVSEDVHGANRKVANLINMVAEAPAGLLILSDSDIAVPAGYVGLVAGALSTEGHGVVTCPYVGRAAGGIWARLAAMGVSYQFLPSVLCGVGLGLARPCMGSTIALTSTVLDAIGGFAAFKDVLADDYAIGAAVRAHGGRSALAPVIVAHTCDEESLASLFAHEGRWALTVRRVDPAGHAGSILTHPVPLALASLMLLGPRPATLALLGAALLARAWVKLCVDRAAGERAGSLWLLPLRDVVSFMIFVRSFIAGSVEWRGERFHVTRSGGLRPV